jgi:hypothetical protein
LILATLIHSFNLQQKRTAVSSLTSKALILNAMQLSIHKLTITLACMTTVHVKETFHALVKQFKHMKLYAVVVVSDVLAPLLINVVFVLETEAAVRAQLTPSLPMAIPITEHSMVWHTTSKENASTFLSWIRVVPLT